MYLIMYNNYTKDTEFLQDLNPKTQKETDWKGKKLKTLDLSESYKRLKQNNKHQRVLNCGTFLEFRQYLDSGEKKLNYANFCKVRLCPMCSWRRSLKVFGQVSKVMNHIEQHHDYKYIFLTLTIKNCHGEYLKDTLDVMMSSFNKLARRKAFRIAAKGYFRGLEITHNKKDDTYHPHFHLVIAVNKSYFTDPKFYLSQKKWTSMWKSCLGVNYTPIVDVRTVKGDYKKAVAEISKYSVKSSDIIAKDSLGEIDETYTDSIVKTLDNALAYRRLISFGLLFKEVHRKLKLDDTEDGDLTHTDNDDIRNDLAYMLLRYRWGIGHRNYVLIGQENGNVDVDTGEILE